MRRREFYWSLFHRDTNNQLNELRTSQVEAIYAAIPVKDRPQWMIWKEGFKAWKAFAEFPVLLKDLRHTKPEVTMPPPIPQKKIEVFEREMDKELSKALDIEKRGHARNENRENNRFSGKFKVRIASDDKTFESLTLNISMVGMLLEKPLPEWIPKYFTVELTPAERSKVSPIAFLCSQIKVAGEKKSGRLKIESNDNNEVLRQWLVSTTY